MKSERAVLAELGRQLLGGIEDQNTLRGLADHLLLNCNPETLVTIKAAIDAILRVEVRSDGDAT
jgi:hypothetical protein